MELSGPKRLAAKEPGTKNDDSDLGFTPAAKQLMCGRINRGGGH
jgi:hypothetical protein